MRVVGGIFLVQLITIISCDPLVTIDSGTIRGRIINTPDNDIYAFQDIPYAAPPIGPLRFQPPQPVAPWSGILDTIENTRICYNVHSDTPDESEDCLLLNVYTTKLPRPRGVKDKLSAVYCFIHGGSFSDFSASINEFDPRFLLQKQVGVQDIIVVTPNYRQGVFGFASTGDDVLPGNYGLKDLLLALKWIQRNIRAFGGDPSKVTLGGHSSGAALVSYLALSPKSKGLFRATIEQSGSSLNPFAFQRNPKYYAEQLVRSINTTLDESLTSEQIRDLLQNAPSTELDAAGAAIQNLEFFDTLQQLHGFYLGPVLERNRKTGIVLGPMFEDIKDGKAQRLTRLKGITDEEALQASTTVEFTAWYMSWFDDNPAWLVASDMHVEPENKDFVGRQIRRVYVGDGLFQDNPGQAVTFLSDTFLNRPITKDAVLQSRFSKVYFYQFSYPGPLGGNIGDIPGARRVGHGSDINYLWGSAWNSDLSQFPEQDLVIQQRLLLLWKNFINTLNPTPKRSPLLQNVIWPSTSRILPGLLPYLDIDVNLTVRINPKRPYMKIWDGLYLLYGKRPFDTY